MCNTRNSTAYLNLLLEEAPLTSKCLKSNLKYVDECRVFQKKATNSETTELVSTINSKLHATGDDRSKALLLLETLLSQCPAQIFNDNSSTWVQQCFRWNQHTVDDELRILRRMIEKALSNPEAKKVILTFIPRFVERLTNLDKFRKSTQTIINTLRCLRSLIHGYSSSCGPHRGTFQKYVTFCLTEYVTDEVVIGEAAACFVALCECGTRGQQDINFKEAWSSKFTLLINTCHKLLDSVYSPVDGTVKYIGLFAVKQIEEFLPELLNSTEKCNITPMKRYHGLLDRFVVLAELLRAMLLCQYSTSKSFRPIDVLNLIYRVLSVTGSVLEECGQTNDTLALAAIIPDLHELAFNIMEALITSVKRNLIPYGSVICKLCLQSLKWTHKNEWSYGSQKPFQSLRCKVYSILCSWMLVAGSCSFIEIFADEIIRIIIDDVQFVEPSVKLTVTTKTNPKKSKSRKRSHIATEMNLQSESCVLIDRMANANMCAAAHQTLQLLLRHASVLIKWEQHKNLQYVILPILTKMFNAQSSSRYPLPYSDSKCRRHLFASLLSLVQDPHPKWTSPLSLAIRFLTLGTQDENIEVASFCKMSLCHLETSIHPRCSTLYLPREDAAKSITLESRDRTEVEIPSTSFAASTKLPVITADETSSIQQATSVQTVEAIPSIPFIASTKLPVITADETSSIQQASSVQTMESLAIDASHEETRLVTSNVSHSSASDCDEIRLISNEPASKKSKLSTVCEVDDEKVAAMLSDFVDA